ncbi:MAG: glycosyltransferase [Acidobacteria bacterium]|nr:glycosyltransferase [Acidobacteriota bacterium]
MRPNVVNPTCDVVIPAHNAEKYIADAISSVFAQDFAVDQIIVVDDASTDGTAASAAATGSRLRILKTGAGRAGVARNLGVRHSRSELIAFLDADDICLPGRLRLQAEMLAASPEAAMVFCDAEYADSAGWPTGAVFTCPDFRREIFSGQLFERNRILTTSVAMVRRTAFEAAGGFDETLVQCEDYDLWIRLARSGSVEHIPRPLVRYRLHSSNISSDRKGSRFWEKAILNKYELNEIRSALLAVHRDSQKADLRLSCVMFRMGRYDEGERLLLRVTPSEGEEWLRYFGLANYAFSRGDELAAEKNYVLALECNPECAECINNLGVIAAGQGGLDQAMRHFLKAAALRPGYSDARRNAEALKRKSISELCLTLVPLRPVLRPDLTDAQEVGGMNHNLMQILRDESA